MKVVGFLAFALVAFTFYQVFSTPSSSRARPVAVQTYRLDTRPDSQKNFEKITMGHHAEFTRANRNELQESTARNNRMRALRQAGTGTAGNWVGKVDDIGTNNDGKAILTIRLNENTSVATWNNALSDIVDGTLIPPGTPLFNSVASLRKGQTVRFSGNFFPGNELDHLRTQGLTVRDAMRDTTFLMKFTAVSVLPNNPSATADVNLREGPSTDTPSLATIPKGTSVVLLGNVDAQGWVKVGHDGKEGYVGSRNLGY
ncbi:MAG: SH3 domain-containing protein [Treponema sp.]|nr:SH3 domain-containing protein [Treponema sp.]